MADVYELTVTSNSLLLTTRAGAPDGYEVVVASAVTGPPGTYIPRSREIETATTLTPMLQTEDMIFITQLATDLAIANPTGHANVPGRKMMIRITDDGTPRNLSWGNQYRSRGNVLPATTTVGTSLYLGFIFDHIDSRWDLVAVAK